MNKWLIPRIEFFYIYYVIFVRKHSCLVIIKKNSRCRKVRCVVISAVSNETQNILRDFATRKIYSRHSLSRICAISNMRYLEHFAISNKSPGPFSIYSQTPYKFARYLELRYLELFAISNHFLGP